MDPISHFDCSFSEVRRWWFYFECFAEFLGTMLFLSILTGTINSNTQGKDVTTMHVALSIALFFPVLVETFGSISGAHFNPAVSLGFFLHGKISIIRFLIYVPMQCLGAIFGSLIIKWMIPNATMAETTAHSSISVGQAFVLEIIATFLLMTAIFSIADDGLQKFKGSGPASFVPAIMVGFAIAACVAMTGVYTGASMNPARSLGPSVAKGSFKSDFWIYIVAPPIGSILSVMYQKLNLVREMALKNQASVADFSVQENSP